MELLQLELGSGLSDQRRGNLPRIQVKPDEQKPDQDDKADQRKQETQTHHAFLLLAMTGATGVFLPEGVFFPEVFLSSAGSRSLREVRR